MADIIDENGITVQSLSETIAALETGLRGIYGEDTNLQQNSPDGQLVNIFAQGAQDIRELAVQVFNSFDPDSAQGTVLDQRVVINNIARQGGTFTITPITFILDRTVSLQGLDANFADINGTGFTVQDDAGNQFILIDSDTFTAGTYSRNFRARQLGRVEVAINTIVNQTTVVLGVTSVNNPSAPLELGQNEENDIQLRVRRARSPALSSNGFLNGLEAAVLAIEGVTDAKAYENVTNAVDADGIPAHGTWLIVEGGANTAIGQAYYAKKSYGSNMRGDVEVPITTPSGSVFTAKFDRPTAEDLYIRFEIKRTLSSAIFNEALIKDYIVANKTYTIGEFAETSSITAIALAAINDSGGGGVPINVEISNNGTTWVDFLEVTTLDRKFTLDDARITITVLA